MYIQYKNKHTCVVLKSNRYHQWTLKKIYAEGILDNVSGHKLSYLQLCGYKMKMNVRLKPRKLIEFFG